MPAVLGRTVLMVWLVLAVVATAAHAGDRIALVIGNSAYQHTAPLKNPAHDAADMAAALRKLGFDVVEAENLDGEHFADMVSQFTRKLRGAKVGLFYYAGHAMQYENTNYLMPVDATLKNAFQLKREMIAVSDILEVMESTVPLDLVFLDACRDNPLADELTRTLTAQGRAVSQTRGLARISTRGRNTLIAFAAGPGHEARDGQGRNSPFTGALLSHMSTPGLEVETMLKRVTQDVLKETNNFQEPERLSRLTDEFYFKPEKPKPAVQQPAVQQPSVIQQNSPFTPDALHWSLVKDTINPDLLREFIQRYPHSPFRADAESRLKALESKAEPAKPTVNSEAAARFLDRLLPQGTSKLYALTLPQNMRLKVADGLKRGGYLADPADDYVKNGTDQFALRFAVLKFQQAEGIAQTGYLSRDEVIRLLSRDSDIQKLAASQSPPQPDTKTSTEKPHNEPSKRSEDPAEAFAKLSLSSIERLRIARTLEMMGLTKNGFPEKFVERGEADTVFVDAIKAFQRGRGFSVTGYPDADQVRYLVSLGDKKSRWETQKQARSSDESLKLGNLTRAQVISRVKLALGATDTSGDQWRTALKRWQADNGFEQNGLLKREIFARLLDVAVDIPAPNWSTDASFSDWGFWQNPNDKERRCYIFTFAKSMIGRYADAEMPDMTMSRVPSWPDGHMSATYVKSRWFDPAHPVSITVDGTSYQTTTREGYYWPRITGNNEYSDEIMKALAKTTNEVTVVGTSPWGGKLRMTFSASGFTSAFKHLDSHCAHNTLTVWLR